ncbi:reticulon family protein [Cavenderia fasciculata]|uniref:Reticulon-like protein n=1 Tax=Cavenderia fasciculata TaxID=261658 RepID=F4QCV9_CACFS|nr:reticulon family protein [Cavenderia fasciculata]EGG14483.1 reticulon family protein [Cavenderia fasciculata]|eukprot:XP_004353892.1 reticulon family protein [Cavenderia fasciculata]
MSDTEEIIKEIEETVEETKEQVNEVIGETVEKIEEVKEQVKEEAKAVINNAAETVKAATTCPVSSSTSSSSSSTCPATSTCCPALMCGDVSICQHFENICGAVKSLPCHECSKKILVWDDLVQTGLLFGIINLVFFLVCVCQYSIISLVGYSCMVASVSSVLFRIVSSVCDKYIPNCTLDNPILDKLKTLNFHVEDEVVQKYVKGVGQLVNSVLALAKDIFGCKNIVLTAEAALLFFVVATVAKCISGATILYLVFLVAFIAPRLYLEKQQIIDEQLAKVKATLKDMIHLAHNYMPKHTTTAKKNN